MLGMAGIVPGDGGREGPSAAMTWCREKRSAAEKECSAASLCTENERSVAEKKVNVAARHREECSTAEKYAAADPPRKKQPVQAKCGSDSNQQRSRTVEDITDQGRFVW